MPRPLRFQPEPWTVHFVTTRCIQGRHLLLPTGEVPALMVGVLERASRQAEVKLHAAAALSNHMHLLVSARTMGDLAAYMGFVDGNISRKVGAVHDWPGKMWDGPYKSAPCLDEAAQLERLGYLLAHGAKEGLVKSADRWPGLHSYRALLHGKPMRGYWVDGTGLCNERRRDGGVSERGFREECALTLHRLPALEGLSESECRGVVRRLYEEAVAKHRPEPDGPVLGVRAVLGTDPHTRADDPERRPAPRCHTASRALREAFLEAYAVFVQAYREALCELRVLGHARFPAGGVPPVGIRPAPS
jgi:REP element-mobilizing transposase RayT